MASVLEKLKQQVSNRRDLKVIDWAICLILSCLVVVVGARGGRV
jgi:hypothetical protein